MRDGAPGENTAAAAAPRPAGFQRRRRLTALVGALTLLGAALAGCGPAAEPGPGEDGRTASATGSPGSASPSSPDQQPSPEPPPTLSWGPLVSEAERAQRIVAKMNTSQQAGQVLMAHLPGTTTLDPAIVTQTHLGGLILMSDNISSAAQAKKLSQDFDRAAKRASGQDVPALIGIDQEGGLVQRYIEDETPFPTAMAYGAIYAYDQSEARALAQEGYRRLGNQIRELGVTIDFAPDADVTAGATDPVIGARSFSGDPQAAAELTVAASQGLADSGVLPVVKHFPGHGSVATDSHHALPVITKSVAELVEADWVPFRAAIKDGVPAVMTGHLATSDAPDVPATVKPDSYRQLKDKLGFAGLNVTDAMNMGAIVNSYGAGPATVAALLAGADLVLMPGDIVLAHGAIVSAITDGELAAERLTDAATKVVTAKLYQQRLAAERKKPDEGADEKFITEVFAKAITDVSESCAARPRATAASPVYGADAQQQQLLRSALTSAGQQPGSAAEAVALVGVDQLSVDAATTVTLNSPWPLASSQAGQKYALYGKGRAGMAALADVLSGKKTAPGRLPVAVGDYPAGTGCGPRG